MRGLRYISLLSLVLGLTIQGCHRRPLEDPENYVRVTVKIDVSDIPNVTKDIYNDKIPAPVIKPEVMRVLFYSSDGEHIAADTYIFNVKEEDGTMVMYGDVNILPGKYRLLAYNFDTESTLIRNDSRLGTIEAYTGTVTKNLGKAFSVKAGLSESFVYEPDHLVVAREFDCEIPYHEGVYEIRTEARSIVDTYYLQIKVDGLQYVAGAQAVLSGLVSSNKIAGDTRITDPQANVYFTMQKSLDDGSDVICAVFSTFGKIPDTDNDLVVTFSIATVDGKIMQLPFEISSLFDSEDGRLRHWLLLDQKITVDKPETPVTGGGFLPEVGDWETEEHEVLI